jgi:hypothetical protein
MIYYRILSLDETEGAIVVRYWSDEMSERDLSIIPGDTNATPEHCRTDTNLNVFDSRMTADQLHDFLVDGAPADWLGMKARIRDPSIDTSLPQIMAMVGTSKECVRKADGKKTDKTVISHSALLIRSARDETIITELLYAEPSDKDPPGRMILANVKTKLGGKWTYPTTYTPNEVQTVVNPYLQLIYNNCPGILAPSNTVFESSDVYVVKFLCADIAAARNLHRWLAVESKNTPEQQALMALAKRYQEAAGATYAMSWRLSYMKEFDSQ